MVYVRTHGSHTFRFQVSGMLWRNALIMQDRETGSAWSQVTGKAILGPLAGEELERHPSVQTTWKEWRAAHPETLVLRKSDDVLSSHYQKYFDDPERMGLFRSRWLVEKMPGKSLVYGITLGPHAAAITSKALARGAPVHLKLGEKPVVASRSASGGVVVWTAAESTALHFVRDPGTTSRYRDRKSGSLWDLETGRCVDGKLAGTRLVAVSTTEVYWFAWSSFYPNTQVVD